MKTMVVVPTYNERQNLSQLAPRVLAALPDVLLLVVDDASPDGTGKLADEMAGLDSRIHVLHRPRKMGLGSAYVDGFRHALSTNADLVVQMDADFSHDPGAIPHFLTEIEKADLVLGSRYLNGVTVVNWPLSRLFLSVGANMYTRVVTGMPLKDATGGFKCFRREVLERLPLETIKSDGYSFQIEVNFISWKKGFRIKEIPIVFVDRTAGASKMSRRIVFEAVFLVWKLRLESLYKDFRKD